MKNFMLNHGLNREGGLQLTNPTTFLPPDQINRSIIREDLDSTILVEAAAGTGKTTSMVGRMVSLLAAGKCSAHTLAAVTFTRKAAAELRSRFQIELERQTAGSMPPETDRLRKALSEVDRCFIGTIHSFCGRMIRERPVEAGVAVDFEEIEETQDASLRSQAWQEYVSGLYQSNDPLLHVIQDLGVEIDELEDSFIRFADYPDVDEWPSRLVRLPDIEPAKTALKDFVSHIEKLAHTLPQHSGGDGLIPKYRLLPLMFRQAHGFQKVYQLMEILDQFGPVKTVFKMWPGGAAQAKDETEKWNEFTQQFAKPLVQTWKEHRYPYLLNAIRQAMEVYERLKQDSGKLNYQDLLIRAARLLRDKPRVRKFFRSRFTHLLIDEFQDTDPVQAEVMMLLVSDDRDTTDWRKCRPVPGSLFVVGDPKQSIYRFRRADMVTYNQVKKMIMENGGKVITLSANFRTISPMIDWVNATFASEFSKFPPECSPEYVPLMKVRQDTDGLDVTGIRALRVPKSCSKNDEIVALEADLIARTIQNSMEKGLIVSRNSTSAHNGPPSGAQPGDFLIITTRKANLSAYGLKLQELRIPYQVAGGATLNESTELKLLHTLLLAATQPHNPIPLVAVLRGGLFGVSDPDLFHFKRAGGQFYYYSDVPESLDSKLFSAFSSAFGKLQEYHQWLMEMPPVTAIEKVAADSGMDVMAVLGPGGDVRAGSLMKAIELLRIEGSKLRTLSECVDFLGGLVDQRETHDAISVLPQGNSVVRVMNLHKVKGLEAPVVFLADPTGRSHHVPMLYIDRTEDKARGYLSIEAGARGSRRKQVVAVPTGWDRLVEKETNFQNAEELRLLYVAATRAGCLLSVSQRESRNNYNPWCFFANALTEQPSLEDPGSHGHIRQQELRITEDESFAASQAIQKKWLAAREKTYETISVKSLTTRHDTLSHATGEQGVAWGSVIHLLLETAMRNPEADLESLAVMALSDQGVDPGLALDCIELVRIVQDSGVWKRAQGAEQCLVEVPFQMTIPSEDGIIKRPTILRGIIDLVFKEPAGWTIVDYKSDRVPDSRQAEMVEAYLPQLAHYAHSWTQMTGERVSEMGFYFTHWQKYVAVEFR